MSLQKIFTPIIMISCLTFTLKAMDLSPSSAAKDSASEAIPEDIHVSPIPLESQESSFIQAENLDFSPSSQESAQVRRSCLGLSIDGGGGKRLNACYLVKRP
jgi:hypothetical protein